MALFLIPLLLGFALNALSAFTATFSSRWGENRGRNITFILRNILGVPLWVAGFILAAWLPSTLMFRFNLLTDTLGWLLIAAGVVFILAALTSLGRRALSPTVKDTLVESGPYAVVRHPLYWGVIFEFSGMALTNPTRSFVLASALGIAWIVVQAWLEERDLLQRMPEYREYMQRVPMFVPWKHVNRETGGQGDGGQGKRKTGNQVNK